jgi:hypothetical protein
MSFDEEYRRLGSSSGTGRQRPSKNYQIFIVVTGLDIHCESRSKEYKDASKAFNIRANVHHRAHVFSCERRHELTQRLFDTSADQGIKPYKHVPPPISCLDTAGLDSDGLIKGSHFPYVSNVATQSGATSRETYTNMVMKIHKYTRPVAGKTAFRGTLAI